MNKICTNTYNVQFKSIKRKIPAAPIKVGMSAEGIAIFFLLVVCFDSRLFGSKNSSKVYASVNYSVRLYKAHTSFVIGQNSNILSFS